VNCKTSDALSILRIALDFSSPSFFDQPRLSKGEVIAPLRKTGVDAPSKQRVLLLQPRQLLVQVVHFA
jgi:hypothetical protein